MYTRSRQSQNFTGGTPQRNQGSSGNQGYNQSQPNSYNNQGNYQGGQNQNAYKQQGGTNTPYKQTSQQPQTLPQQARNVQQVKQQQNQQQVPQQQIKQQPQQSQQQQQTPQPQRLKPILKTANVQGNQSQGQNQGQGQSQSQAQNFTQHQPNQQNQQNQSILQNQVQQQINNGMEINDNPPEITDSEVQDIPKWKRKNPSVKVNKKLKRLRLNQRLRKTLQPKNAIMVLNEMKTGVHFTFPEAQSSLPNSLFLVHAEIDGKTYVGQGVSKPLARQNAAENALKSLLLEKMMAAAMKARSDAESDGTGSQVGDGVDSKDMDSSPMDTNAEDPNEIPWSSLASFALYKLFLEWQNQGTVVPVPRPGLSTGKVKKESSKPAVPKELPVNPTTIHPVMLLNQMRPGLIYTEVSRVGNPPNTTFTLGVEIDGQEYTGTAKNKKDAKKFAAKAALHGLYNLVYPDEKESDDVNIG